LTHFVRINTSDETKPVDFQMRSQGFHRAAINCLCHITLEHCIRRAQNCAAWTQELRVRIPFIAWIFLHIFLQCPMVLDSWQLSHSQSMVLTSRF